MSYHLEITANRRSTTSFTWTENHSVHIPSEGTFDRAQEYVCDRESDTTIQTAEVGVSAGVVKVRHAASQYESQALSNDAIQRICNHAKFKAFLAHASERMFAELEKEASMSVYR